LSSKTSEKEKEMNGDPVMKSSSQMLFTKTMTPRIGSHVRNLSNGGTVSTHPLTTNSVHEKNQRGSSSRKGTHNTSMYEIDDNDNEKDDDDIEPKSVRKVIIQHKKRASKRSTTPTAKEYDDDGNTIIKPMKCIELSSESHASSISACSTSVSSENNDTSTKVSRSRSSKSRSKKSRDVLVVDGSSNGDTGEDGHGGRRTHSSKMMKEKALSALAGAKDGAMHVAAFSKSAMDGWGKKGVSGRKWQSALFV
jgi:hypothetical protein